ncbi:MAG TPA: hypothetical protein VFB14_25050 [Bryobacteraceae bacterium]|nr:hypothetical protein [Bryobacteraceae bacterium]
MVNAQPGRYATTPDAIITLKQAGVSDKVIAALVTSSKSETASVLPVTPSGDPLVLHDGTPVRLRLTRNLSSSDTVAGTNVDFDVIEDVKVADLIVIARGAKAIGTITDAEHKKRVARGGKVNVTIDFARLVNGDKVALRAVKEASGGGHTGGMTAGMVATAVVFWPAAPFFLFMHGKDANIPEGTEITAFTQGELKLDRAKLAQAAKVAE